ncbi:MAG TPA: HAMP domain-containing sensor histidine kinase [Dinghuibacter sp.]|uniref:HAMP domain-containing sensor histidine kinase n=1 Tax=Dinghuibacter sp. TaxID=2024697 RepID=UPI002D0F20EE|nr:HAMP domain-containing sensor histidine kinase [Dinghuibacter sp.]HTJ13894.1 HAMP domain-containing sensor histidine kinase [Dinghuibacter sp.]
MLLKVRITLLFSLLALLILLLVCGSVYYISYRNRISDIRTRLTNTAITTSRLLGESGVFDGGLLRKIDSATAMAMKAKVIEAYDSLGKKVYWYSDNPSDSIGMGKDALGTVWQKKILYFTRNGKDVVACYYRCAGHGQVVVAAAFDEDGIERLSHLRRVLSLSFIGGLLISVSFGYFFSLSLLHPLRRISDEVNEISAKNLARRIRSVSQNKNDEWFYLSDTLNRLLNRLQESFDTQAMFISNASHELSTPLTSISNQLEVALQRLRTPEGYQRVIQSVYQDVQQLSNLTQTLLEFAKASGTSRGLDIDLVRIDEILLSLPGEMVKTDGSYSVTLDFDRLPEHEEELFVFGNAALLFNAVKNIVLNACKYSPDHHAIVRLAVENRAICVTVSNIGKGIAEEDREKIFQPFYRLEEDQSTPGFGLGLSLATRIIKLHKGTITVDSGVDAGATFTILLPGGGIN